MLKSVSSELCCCRLGIESPNSARSERHQRHRRDRRADDQPDLARAVARRQQQERQQQDRGELDRDRDHQRRARGAVAPRQHQRDRAHRRDEHEEVVVKARDGVDQEDRVERHEHDGEARIAAQPPRAVPDERDEAEAHRDRDAPSAPSRRRGSEVNASG